MNNKVNMEEVNLFLNELQKASAETKATIRSVSQKIETISEMDSFSGKAAQESKRYFSDFHLIILESFRGLFDDLEKIYKSIFKYSSQTLIRMTPPLYRVIIYKMLKRTLKKPTK